jgi:hypothetical protein
LASELIKKSEEALTSQDKKREEEDAWWNKIGKNAETGGDHHQVHASSFIDVGAADAKKEDNAPKLSYISMRYR